MTRVRLTEHHGQLWINLEDLRMALKDDEAVLKAAAMLKVARDKGDPPLEMLRLAIAHFITELTGVLDQGGN